MVRIFRGKIGVLIVLAVFSLAFTAAIKAEASEGKIDINTASVAEFQTLKGIGETIAQRIVDYREKNGFFKSTEDLMNTKGIGKTTFENIKDKITVNNTVNEAAKK